MGVMGWSGRSEGEIAWKREGKSQGRGDARVGNWAAKIGGRGWNREWRGKGKVRDAGGKFDARNFGGGGGGEDEGGRREGGEKMALELGREDGSSGRFPEAVRGRRIVGDGNWEGKSEGLMDESVEEREGRGVGNGRR